MKKMNLLLTAAMTLATSLSFAGNTTDYSVCATGPQATSIERAWKLEQQEQGITFQLILAVAKNQVMMTNTCTTGGRSLQASVSSPSIYDASTLVIQSSAAKSEHSDDGAGNTMNCDVSVQATSMQYQLRGACLVFKDPASGAEMVFTPAN